MRYYLYLDKEFLKSLFASIPEVNFDVEIMEFSVQNGETITKDTNIAPNVNGMFDSESFQKSDNDKNDKSDKNNKVKDRDNKNRCRKQLGGGLTFFTGEKNTCSTIVERRYINIEEVSGIKNLSFYNKLINKLEKICNDKSSLCIENGKIYPCKLKNLYKDIDDRQYPKNNQFFCINGKYIWINSENLETDLFFLSTITSEVKVIGFVINKINNIQIVKALAIYIE